MRELFVGNVPFNATEKEIVDFFEDRGVHVLDAPRFMRDKHTRDFLGFAFVKIDADIDPSDESGPFFGQELRGRTLRIEIAKGPRQSGFSGPDPARRERARAARQRSHEDLSY